MSTNSDMADIIRQWSPQYLRSEVARLRSRNEELEAALRREQRDLDVCYRVIQAAQQAPGASLPRDIFESWLDDLLNDPAPSPPDSEPAEGAGGDDVCMCGLTYSEHTPEDGHSFTPMREHYDTAQRQDAMDALDKLYQAAKDTSDGLWPGEAMDAKALILRHLSRANDEGGVTSKLREKIDYRYRKAASRGRGHYCPWRIGLEAVKQSADELDRAVAEQGEKRMVPVYAVPEDVEAHNETCFTLHDNPPFGADFLTLFRAAAPPPEQEGESDG